MGFGSRDSGFGQRVPSHDSRVPTLYAILDADVAARAGWTLVDLASACLAGGATFLQVRAKHAASGWLLDTAAAIVERARGAGAIVIVNDRADVARLAKADGVHVGQEDLAPASARTLLADTAIVGLSTHTVDQVEAALAQPISYLAIGPVFGTSTKATGYEAIGLGRVREAASRARPQPIPVVAIGGITLESAADVLQAGADSIAVISDLMTTGNPEGRVREYLRRLKV
jgi:thiamine-phosphate pyrophosphorylase